MTTRVDRGRCFGVVFEAFGIVFGVFVLSCPDPVHAYDKSSNIEQAEQPFTYQSLTYQSRC